MKMKFGFLLVLIFSAVLSSATVRPTHVLAYTDPGSGAMLWQILVSSGVIAGFYFSRLRNWLFGDRARKSAEETSDSRPAGSS